MNTDLPATVPYAYTDARYVDEHLEGIGGISLGVNIGDAWVSTDQLRRRTRTPRRTRPETHQP